MARTVLVTGGARSGKSRMAETMTERFGAPLAYIATAEPGDAEMHERIARHRARRGPTWQTIEEPIAITEVILRHDGHFRAVLVDCITLWLANLLFRHDDRSQVLAAVTGLAAAFPGLKTPLVLVTNEVGMGIVPENDLARAFRDLAGEANEILAEAADEVYVTFSGLPLKLK